MMKMCYRLTLVHLALILDCTWPGHLRHSCATLIDEPTGQANEQLPEFRFGDYFNRFFVGGVGANGVAGQVN